MRTRLLVACALLTASFSACSGDAGTTGPVTRDQAITVGSFNFPESELIAEIYAGALEGAGFTVRRERQVGTRELVLPALQRGLLEVVPEYGGSALTFLGGHATADTDETHRLLARALAERGITALRPASAESRNGLVVTSKTADRLALIRLSDLAEVDHAMILGGPPECPERDLCLPGFEQTYGLSFEAFLPLDTGGPLTAEALERGTVDVAVVFTSEGALVDRNLVLLRDDLRLQPAENITPLVRTDVLERFGPDMAVALDDVSALLTTQALRQMNAAIAEGAEPAEVAGQWLEENGSGPTQE